MYSYLFLHFYIYKLWLYVHKFEPSQTCQPQGGKNLEVNYKKPGDLAKKLEI